MHLVRDSRGVVFSWMKKVVRPEITDDEAHFEEFSPASAGVRWMECNLAFELLRRLRTPTVPGCATSRSSGEPQRELSAGCSTVSTPATTTSAFLDDGEVEVAATSTSSAATRCGSRTAASASASTTPGAPQMHGARAGW